MTIPCLSRKEAARLTRLLRQPRPCLLCGAFPPTYGGIFVPDTPELWGVTPGKVRLLGYALCARCMTVPERTLHVEACLMAGLVGRSNEPRGAAAANACPR